MSATKRILSIDAFRGITILTMVFVNELAGIRDIPEWMKHAHAKDDTMTFVDMVFPAFLFIVGMSIPFALNNRIKKGSDFLQLQWHIIWRTIGLLILGVFMVNGEGGNYNEAAMGMSIGLWLLLFYVCIILVWNIYTFKNKTWVWCLRTIGIAGLIALAFIYRGGQNGDEYMKPRWWGILGLIGWAYLYACILFQLFKGNRWALLACVAFCITWYIAGKTAYVSEHSGLHWVAAQAGNAAHTSIVLSGMVLSLIYFGNDSALKRSFIEALLLAILFLVAGYLLRPYYKISKIYATPTWCLYSAAACTVLYSLLYWLIDVKGIKRWTAFFKPAATNPLLTYIIPDIIFALCLVLHISLIPDSLRYGMPGIIWSLCYAVVVMFIAMGLNKLKIRLQL
ncbi:MAG: DUF5009 domain-containing protein [Agriterribacter sp.]